MLIAENIQLTIRLKGQFCSLESQLPELEKLVLFSAVFAHTHFFLDILFQNFRLVSAAPSHAHSGTAKGLYHSSRTTLTSLMLTRWLHLCATDNECTHTQASPRAHTDTSTHICICTHTTPHTHTYTHTHTQIAHMHPHHTRMHPHTPVVSYAHTHTVLLLTCDRRSSRSRGSDASSPSLRKRSGTHCTCQWCLHSASDLCVQLYDG